MRRIVLGLVGLSLFGGCAVAANEESPGGSEGSGSSASSALPGVPVKGGALREPLPEVALATVDAGTCTTKMSLPSAPGLVIAQVAVNQVYWGSYWSLAGATEKSSYNTTWADLASNPAFYARLAEYSTSVATITTGSWTGSSLAYPTLSSGTTITEDQIQTELRAEIAAGTVEARTNSRLYVIMLPPGVTSALDQQYSYAGHHGAFVDSSGNPVYYAVITYSASATYQDPLISHEISEAVTDPDVVSGWRDGSGNEIGDDCRFNYATLDGYTIETIWSNLNCACVGPGTTNPIKNGGFETGTLTSWTTSGTTSVSSVAHTGAHSAMAGAKTPTSGNSSIVQKFKAPSEGGSLSFAYRVVCSDTVQFDWATATLTDTTSGTSTTPLAKTCTNTGTWSNVSAPLTADHSYTLTLTNRDDGRAGNPTYTLFDDIAIVPPPPPPPPPVVINGDFELGNISGWNSVGAGGISTVAHSGKYSAILGTVGTATNGDSLMSQWFKAPALATSLTFFYQVVCKDTVANDWATATLQDFTANTVTTPLAPTCSNTGKWSQVTVPVTGGHAYTLTLTSHDDNRSGNETYTYFDDVVVK